MAKDIRYSRLSDLIDLLFYINKNKQGITITDIKNRYNISLKTAYRFRQALLDVFPQIDILKIENHVKYWGFKDCDLKELI